MPKWWNWQTRWTQNPVRLKSRVGSSPTFGTNPLNIFSEDFLLKISLGSAPKAHQPLAESPTFGTVNPV